MSFILSLIITLMIFLLLSLLSNIILISYEVVATEINLNNNNNDYNSVNHFYIEEGKEQEIIEGGKEEEEEVNRRPIWGILTQPIEDEYQNEMPHYTSQIDAGYVKWLEGSGARVVPIPYNSTQMELNRIFHHINGILFPGGPDIIDGTQYYNTSKILFDLVIESNLKGDYFPIHGTCLGFELLAVLVARGNNKILTCFNAENITLPMEFIDHDYREIKRKSRFYSDITIEEYFSYQHRPLTTNNHHYGISFETFNRNSYLNLFFKPLTYSYDRNNRKFIASMEAKSLDLPVYAVQYHPEKTLYSWPLDQAINKSPTAITAMQKIADFIVSESRKSKHRYPNTNDELDSLIYNYDIVFTQKKFNSSCEQMYFFKF